ncbi:type II toxin-antitoxin system VapC family toxin [Deinococcus planocerae]|uniref:type II toxin-antitoxin system VapC family toxin n=1 Tax=Deinococcus planocerae TaxID=1737569 RepID=UPI000C7F66C4|nr:type II toxin-antitoxin system VapC family toxin [Deinococcus planocerae]
MICGVVYAELHGRRHTTRAAIDTFLNGTGIRLDPQMSLDAWVEAGRANADYHARRRAGGAAGIRPVLPDFLIGAHAQHHAHRLFTLNPADFADFPQLRVLTL